MKGNILKDYIKNVFQLEISLYNQNLLYKNLSNQINMLNNMEDAPLERKITVSNFIDFDGGDFLGGIVAGGGIGGMIGLIVGIVVQFRRIYFDILIDWLVGGCLVGIFIGLVIRLCVYIFRLLKARNENFQIKKRNLEVQIQNDTNRKNIQKQIAILKSELLVVNGTYLKTKKVLDVYYSKNIIFPKYRNLVAVSSFYEYLTSGRCTELEGHEGAYNIFENEIRLNVIISKLDQVIAHLDQIRNNQYTLYSAIQDSNRKMNSLFREINSAVGHLQKIENNTKVSAYYSEITAKNTEFLKWIEILKS